MAVMNSRRRPSPLAVIVVDMSFFRKGVRAACADEDPEIWFSDSGRLYDAQRICRGCPLLRGCQAWGLEHKEHGIWGGLTEQRRTRIRNRREAIV